MAEDNARDPILAFARQCGAETSEAEDVARRRGWLDADGNPTAEGHELLEALKDQDSTRSVFRTVP